MDLVKGTEVSDNPTHEINQDSYIKPFIKEFGKEKVFIFDMENNNKQLELNKLFKFLGVSRFNPPSKNRRFNTSYTNDNKTPKNSKYPLIRKMINALKRYFKKHPKLYYTLKRDFHLDYYYQAINHKL